MLKMRSILTRHSASLSRYCRLYNSKIDPKKIVVHTTSAPKPKLEYDKLVFGRTFSDHMIEVEWDESTGWQAPHIKPYGDLQISPAATALHYGIQCFEGMKAYKDSGGKVRMFRPDMNMKRMNSSMERLAMPSLDKDGFLECIKELLRLDSSWVPDQEGYSIYIRPTAIGTSRFLGVHASDQIKLFVVLSPVGPYFKSFKAVKLYADTENIRAWPGGVGNVKVGGNYAPSIAPSRDAAAQHGCSQVLWLYGEDHQITEVGAMNIFFVLKNASSDGIELVTPPLSRGDILPGVTRDSILHLARDLGTETEHSPFSSSSIAHSLSTSLGPVTVSERWITMREVEQAVEQKRLLEIFGAGTAAVVAPVKSILYQGRELEAPVGEAGPGPLAAYFSRSLYDIQYGKIPSHPWSVLL